ncbi:MAG: hypothetical protein IK115_02490 [Lachnospiraceae bacterium]|nr:hypothetical protein [Lachnospiraceae bacterium]
MTGSCCGKNLATPLLCFTLLLGIFPVEGTVLNVQAGSEPEEAPEVIEEGEADGYFP